MGRKRTSKKNKTGQAQNDRDAIIDFVRAMSERRKAEKALKESEQRYRDFFNKLLVPLFETDMKGRVTAGNPALLEAFGYAPDDLEKGVDIFMAVVPKHRELLETNMRRVMKGEKKDASQYVAVRKDGSSFPILAFASPIIREGVTAGMSGAVIDLSERKRIEDALQKSEEKYRLAFESTSDGIFTVDRNFIITSITPSVERQLGYKVEEVLNRPLQDLNILTPESLERAAADVITVLSGVEVTGAVYDFVAKDGTRKKGEVTGTPLIQMGKITGVTAVVRDITERVQAQEALRKSQEKYRYLTDHMSDILWMQDLNLKTTFVSPSIEKILGFTPEERLKQDVESQMTPESLSRVMAIYAEEMEKEKAGTEDPNRSRTIDIEYYHKDGRIVWLENIITGIRDETGKLIGVHGVSRDITARKRAEEERQKLHDQLARAQKMESIGTLAGGIAHDFNNLLMTVQGHVSLMRQGMDPSHPDFERLRLIDEQVDSGAALTRQLLGFARGGKIEVSPRDMNAVVEKTSTLFGRTRKEITIRKKYADDLWTAEVDLGQMEQMFLNLFVNAWHAMPEGGEILLTTENFLLTDTEAFPYAVKPGRYVKIAVTDTGVGMDEKTRAQVFDPFFTTKVMGRGTGLGLAMVYGIVKGHGGMIEVDSEPGKGTTFTIYLPASSGEEMVEKPSLPRVVPGTETILLVDDEEMVLAVNKEMLEFLGYRVLAAGSGQEAVAAYMEKGAGIDLVILDLIMPGVSGAETYDQLKKINPDVRVLLASGYNMGEQSMGILKRGCNAFLQKPFRLETLSQQVREVLDRIL